MARMAPYACFTFVSVLTTNHLKQSKHDTEKRIYANVQI